MIFLQRIDSEVTQEVNNPQQLLQRQRTTGQQNLLSSLPQSSQKLIGQYTMTCFWSKFEHEEPSKYVWCCW
ncbi:hypothetical protein Hanom_Chr13g01221761 [Helianthus anomalus]